MSGKTVNFPNWTAFFTNVPVTATPVPLIARGNQGGIACVMITVGSPPPEPALTAIDLCIVVDPTCPQAVLVQQQAPVPERKNMIRHLRVKRRDPARSDGYSLRLELQGADKAHFIVGGTLATPGDLVEKCSVGERLAQRILNKDGEWQAVFENVLPGAHVLTVGTEAGVKDQVRILIKATD
jgi:hypothetical protein